MEVIKRQYCPDFMLKCFLVAYLINEGNELHSVSYREVRYKTTTNADAPIEGTTHWMVFENDHNSAKKNLIDPLSNGVISFGRMAFIPPAELRDSEKV